MIRLFPDQVRLVDDVRTLLRQHRSVLLQAATGAGKTVMTAAMIAGSQAKSRRAMMVVPRRELLRQTSQTFASFGLPHSYVSAGYPYDAAAPTLIATTGTLARRLDRVPAPDLVVVDETHYGGAELDRIITHYRRAGSWIVGLSATPVRLDGRGLGCWYDAMAEGPPIGDLIANGRLSDYRLYAPATPDLSEIKTVAGDYAKGELAERMEADRVLTGSTVGHYVRHAAGRLGITYCCSIKHGEIVAEQYRSAGVPAVCIHGGMNDGERAGIVQRFARRELLVLTSVDLLAFGFDLASAAGIDVTVESMSDLAPTKSLAKQMQKYGRVLRLKPDPALIFDHAGNCARHGLPDTLRDWSLEGVAKGKRPGHQPAPPVRQCPECFRCHPPALHCPECGFVYPIADRTLTEVSGDLAVVDRATLAPPPPPWEDRAQAHSLSALIAVGRARGMRHPTRWARHVLAARAAKSRRPAP